MLFFDNRKKKNSDKEHIKIFTTWNLKNAVTFVLLEKKKTYKEHIKIFKTWNLKNAVTFVLLEKKKTYFLLHQCCLNPNFHESFIYVYVHNFHWELYLLRTLLLLQPVL